MLLIVKILYLQSVKGGFQSSLIYSLVLLPYPISLTPIPFVSVVYLVSLLPLFFPFSKPLILYIQKETDILVRRWFIMSLSLEYHSHTFSRTQVGHSPPFSNAHPLGSLHTSLFTRTRCGGANTCFVV